MLLSSAPVRTTRAAFDTSVIASNSNETGGKSVRKLVEQSKAYVIFYWSMLGHSECIHGLSSRNGERLKSVNY